MSFNKINAPKDPFEFGNALIEYKNGRPVKPLLMLQAGYQPSYGSIDLANQNNEMVILELEDDE